MPEKWPKINFFSQIFTSNMSKIAGNSVELGSFIARLRALLLAEIRPPLKINWPWPKKKKQQKKQNRKNARKAIKRTPPILTPKLSTFSGPPNRPFPSDPQTAQLFEISGMRPVRRQPRGSRGIYSSRRARRWQWSPLNSWLRNFFRLRFSLLWES